MPFDTTRKATVWSLTINNPTPSDEEAIAQARQKHWKVDGQIEVGKNGTRHYQLIVKTPHIRGAAIKKQFPRAHIEIARDAKKLETYVHKEETRESELPQQNEWYPSLQKVWEMFADWIEDRRETLAKESWSPDKFLQRFDMFIEDMIFQGYVVETIGVNPQVRSCVKKYGRAIVIRANMRRQTDSQTDGNSFAGTSINGENTETQDEENWIEEEESVSSASIPESGTKPSE